MIGEDIVSGEYLKKASSAYRDYINASRPEMEETLIYALKINPNDALASYQLGNLYANFGRLTEAERYWRKATVSNPSMSIPWRNLGLYCWVVKNDHKESEACYRNAISARPPDQTLYRDLAKVLVDNKRIKEAITLLENMKYAGTKRSDIIIDLAQYYIDDARYDKCIDLLTSVPYFVNWEGTSLTWDIFNMANVKKGIVLYEKGEYSSALKAFEKALTFPENLGVGRSMRTEEAMAWFWKGKTLLAMGKGSEALLAWKSGASSFKGSEVQNNYKKLCADLQK
jgi:tetratricopeptide (TPR) repeat protein